MTNFINDLMAKNQSLFLFGLICLLLSILFLILALTTKTKIFGVNAWYKPVKFALSLGIYSWTMAWFCSYLPDFDILSFNLVVIILWSFEILYIAIQAARGQLSHYNVSSPLYSALYGLMAFAASAVTIYTAYIGYLFFTNSFPFLPDYYVWSIRFGILIFVVFSFQGFLMGSRLNHSVGATNDNSNLFILGWSKKVGDLRIAHFIGMHALQIIPLLSFYVLKNTILIFVLCAIYTLLAALTLIQALNGRPLIRQESNISDPQ